MSNWKRNLPKGNIYFETKNGILYNADAMEVIKKLPNNFINLVVTSPPYNVDLGNNKFKKNGYDSYKDNLPFSEYMSWLIVLFSRLYPKLVSGGRLAINIGDKKNGKVPTHVLLMYQLMSIYLPHATIIWNKKQVGNRLSWGSFKSPSNPSYPTPFEYILVMDKENRKLQHKGDSDLTKEEFIEWAYALWEFPPETKMQKFGHPAMFPEELPERVIKMNTYIGDIILDPFAGAGTSLVVAEKLNRKWIGIEISEKYCNITKQRFYEGRLL